MDKEELYLIVLSRYGLSNQINMVFEEFSELQKELCKFLRGKRDMVHIAEEIADVEIMLDQMKYFFKNENLVEEFKKKKMSRLEKRLMNHIEPDVVSYEEELTRAYEK